MQSQCSSLCLSQDRRRVVKAGCARAVGQKVDILGTCTRQYVQEEKAVRIELRYVRVLDDLLVVDLGLMGAPHDKLSMQTPLGMHQVEEPMRMLTCNTCAQQK